MKCLLSINLQFDRWFLYLSLKFPPVTPIYVSSFLPCAWTVAWYTTEFAVLQLPLSGQLGLSLQLQLSFAVASVFVDFSRALLWEDINC